MKKSKGFTLIELLAVIVILAIIALIAAPVILGIIDDARKSAAKDSAYGVVSALKLHFTESLMNSKVTEFNTTEGNSGRKFTCNGTACTATTTVNENGVDKPKTLTLSLDGSVPVGDIILSNAGVATSDTAVTGNPKTGIKFNNKYCFIIEDNKVTDADLAVNCK